MRLDFTIVSLPGNVINLTEYIFIEPSRVFYTAANWTNQAVLLIDGESEPLVILPCASIPWVHLHLLPWIEAVHVMHILDFLPALIKGLWQVFTAAKAAVTSICCGDQTYGHAHAPVRSCCVSGAPVIFNASGSARY